MADIKIPKTCEFEVGMDKIRLATQTNGDVITIRPVHLGAEAVATLAYLINNHTVLCVEIKEKTP